MLVNMFIRKVIKKNKNSQRVIYRLCRSYRTENGPRQQTILTLKDFDLPEEQWSTLAKTIEDKLKGQTLLFCDKNIEFMAEHYAEIIQQNRLSEVYTVTDLGEQDVVEKVKLNTFKHTSVKRIGPEYIGLSVFKELKLDELFKNLDFNKNQQKLAALAIVGRLVFPGSEHYTRECATDTSGIDELLNTSFNDLSNNALYRIADKLYKHKDEIESHLEEKERNLFNLKESLILYDLTNTYFEGRLVDNPKAQFGWSKEKRNDCKLITLCLAIDEDGFPKRSKVMKGNQSEPETLIEMIASLENKTIKEMKQSKHTKKNKTVVVDAGISTKHNLEALKEYGYDYVCVARTQPISQELIDGNKLKKIKDTKKNSLHVQLFENKDENILYCNSSQRKEKENAMLEKMKKKFSEEMSVVKLGISKKGGIKKYDKVLERIGKVKQRNRSIAGNYIIEVTKNEVTQNAEDVKWELDDSDKLDFKFSGSYFLKTNRKDLKEDELWHIYSTLTVVESAFRSMKSELAFRPIFHRKESRTESHLFISVLAYHILNIIRKKLLDNDIHLSWQRLNNLMSSHCIVTSSVKCVNGDIVILRQASEASFFQNGIYQALGIDSKPTKKVITKYRLKNL